MFLALVVWPVGFAPKGKPRGCFLDRFAPYDARHIGKNSSATKESWLRP
jgi:hypothetical protein